MVIGPDFSHEAKSSQYEEIDELLCCAFGRPDEAKLVRKLRSDGDILYEIVKPWQGIAGYAALSRMKAPKEWACLCPLAVRPNAQKGALAQFDRDKDINGGIAGIRHYYQIGRRLVDEFALAVECLPHLPTIITVGTPQFYLNAIKPREAFIELNPKNIASPIPLDQLTILQSGDMVPQTTLHFSQAVVDYWSNLQS